MTEPASVKKTAEEIRDLYHGYRNSSAVETRRELARARATTDADVVAVDYGLLFGVALRSDAERWSWTILPEMTPAPLAIYRQVVPPAEGVLPGGEGTSPG